VHLVRDPVEAEDLVQTTFVAAIEGASSFQAERRLEPWLAGILARQATRVSRPVSARDRRRAFSATVETNGARVTWRTISSARSAVHEETFELPVASAHFGALELAWTLPEGLSIASGVRAHWRRDSTPATADARASGTGCRFDRILPGRYRMVVSPVHAHDPGQVWAATLVLRH